MLLASAAGVLLKNNLERIGPLALAALIGLAAIACYAFASYHKRRADTDRLPLVDDYVLLLGALLVSADVAFIETQFHLLGDNWATHFLFLAIVHAAGAYAYGSTKLLSLSLGALAAWSGFDLQKSLPSATPAFATAAIVLLWRELHRRVRGNAAFVRVFEHAIAWFAIWGAIGVMRERPSFDVGCAMLLAISVTIVWWGFRTRGEAFVLYGCVFAVVAIDAFAIRHIDDDVTIFLVIVVSMFAGVSALLALHRRFTRGEE